ncbi:twin-arginine translocase subunit TatC [Amylibacter sp.]|nr:twin-arginine translocase subunit TatC [Amylibacter sp.]
MSNDENDEHLIEYSAAPLIEHLAELRTRLIYSVLAFVVAMLLCFSFARPLLFFLLEPTAKILQNYGQAPDFTTFAAQENFFVYFRISVLMGFGLSFPIIAFQLWRFVAPGLYKNEQGAFLPFIIASPLLFLAGASFAHYVVSPLAMNFFIGFSDFGTDGTKISIEGEQRAVFVPRVSDVLDLTLKFIFAFGLCFQLPVLLTLLGMGGIVSSQGLRDMRKYAVVGILILAAIVTPPDVITQVILFVVVYMLYEVSIWLVRMVEKKRDDQLAEDGYFDDEMDDE